MKKIMSGKFNLLSGCYKSIFVLSYFYDYIYFYRFDLNLYFYIFRNFIFRILNFMKNIYFGILKNYQWGFM